MVNFVFNFTPFASYFILICVDPVADPYLEYGSIKFLNTNPIWIRIHNSGLSTLCSQEQDLKKNSDRYRTTRAPLNSSVHLADILCTV